MRGGSEAFPQGETYHRRPGAAARRHSGAIRSGDGSRPLRPDGSRGRRRCPPDRAGSTALARLADRGERSAGCGLQLAPLSLSCTITFQAGRAEAQGFSSVSDKSSKAQLDDPESSADPGSVPARAWITWWYTADLWHQAPPRSELGNQEAPSPRSPVFFLRTCFPQPHRLDRRRSPTRALRLIVYTGTGPMRSFSPPASATPPCRARSARSRNQHPARPKLRSHHPGAPSQRPLHPLSLDAAAPCPHPPSTPTAPTSAPW